MLRLQNFPNDTRRRANAHGLSETGHARGKIIDDELQTRLAVTASMLYATSTKRASPEND
ncbi:hypothetical protein [Cohnella terricola]|uniref:Uncharacterized protein n=1 Tax=Cohnella terricola TaxID=1289167 RepID=A0A559JW47_9BACL|nr:hypothetical protein [Cohnella terricola]TVY04122.1 hypothetical protein FPZ45_00510 [Cohnella terricola]